jgi:cobalamin biosynthesis protein CbiD
MNKRKVKGKRSVNSCISLNRGTKRALKTFVAKHEIKGGVSAVVNKASLAYLKQQRRRR